MRLSFSIADQDVSTATSIGIYNLSMGFARSLLLHPDIERMTIFSNSSIRGISDGQGKAEVKYFDYPVRGFPGRLYWDQWACYREARKAGHPWLFLPKGFGSIIRSCPVKLAACLSDTTSVIYRERYPGTVSRSKHAYYVWTHRQTIRHADVIFTISEFSRGEIQAWAKRQGIKCPPVVVAGCAADNEWPSCPRREQILVDVRKAPHKRSDLAVRYVERWRRETNYPGKILAVGTLPDDVHIPAEPSWEFLGRIPDERRKQLMAESQVLVHFTEHEGFGLPPVEALIAGTPAVYSLIPVTREVMGETGCPFLNDDYNSFAAAMEKALAARPDEIAGWGDILKQRHHWTLIGERIVQAFKDYS